MIIHAKRSIRTILERDIDELIGDESLDGNESRNEAKIDKMHWVRRMCIHVDIFCM